MKSANLTIAMLTLDRLGFQLSIDWQALPEEDISRWRRRDLLVTLISRRRRLTMAFSSATDMTIPCRIPSDARKVAQALSDAGVVCTFRPEGVIHGKS